MRRLLALLLLAAVAGGLWLAREPLLARLGRLVVEETPLAPAELVVVAVSDPVLGAEEAAAVVRGGHAPRVLLFAAPATPAREVAERLRIDLPRDEDVARRVLLRLGVRREAIRVAPPAGGTGETVQAIARHAREHGVRRLIVVTRRSHTRRMATLLRQRLPAALVMVRAAPRDTFDPDGWWRDREDARELAMEALRWLNSLVLGDLWADGEAPAPATGAAAARPRSARAARPRRTPGAA